MGKPLSVGDIVHFIAAEGSCRPALAVRVDGESAPVLQVFLDYRDASPASEAADHAEAPFIYWAESVQEDAQGNTLRTWHWPRGANRT